MIRVMLLLILCLSGCAKNIPPPAPETINGQTVEEWEKTLPTSPQIEFHTTSTSFTGWNKFWLGSAIIGQTADVITTVNALSDENCKEVNPLLGDSPSTGAVIALKTIIIAGSVWLVEYHYDKHPKQKDYRNYIYGALGIFGLSVSVWNAGQSCN